MALQVIQDSKGKEMGVFIPIRDWNKMKKRYKDLDTMTAHEPTKAQLLKELKQAVQELQLIEQGKLIARPAKELLDEL